MKSYFCLDIGGTSIKYGVYYEKSGFCDCHTIPTEASKGGSDIINRCKYIIKELLLVHPSIAGICISTAGMVDSDKGIIVHSASHIPRYIGLNIKSIMESFFSLPCEVENDVNCAGIAEYYSGSAKDFSSSLCLTIGTGIGGSFINNSELHHGHSFSALEVGYLMLPDGKFEDIASTSALIRSVVSKRENHTSLNSTYDIDGKTIFKLANEGDIICKESISEMTEYLGQGIASLCYILNPEVVVLGGGITAQGTSFLELVKSSLSNHLIPYVYDNTEILLAENKNQAGMLGAYLNFILKRGTEKCLNMKKV